MPGRPRHDQFELAAELEEGRHAAEQDRERQHLLGDGRRPEQGELRHRSGRGPLGIAGAAHQLHEVQRVDQREDGAEDRPDGLRKRSEK